MRIIQLVAILLLITCVLTFNTLLFGDLVSPIPQRDAWHYIYMYITDWQHRDFIGIIKSLFEKNRGLTDHALPLNRVLFYLNIKYFDLDYRIEAIPGLLGRFILALSPIFYLIGFNGKWKASGTGIILALSGFLLLMTPLSVEAYYWPLSLFGYFTSLLLFVIVLLVWMYLTNKLPFAAFAAVSGLLLVLAGDSPSVFTVGSIIVLLVIYYFTHKNPNKDLLKSLIKLVAFIVSIALVVFLYTSAGYLWMGDQGSLLHKSNNAQNHFWSNIRAILTGALVGADGRILGWAQEPLVVLIGLLVIFGLIIVGKHFYQNGINNFAEFAGLFYVLISIFMIVPIIFFRAESLYAPRYAQVLQLIPLGIVWVLIGKLSQGDQLVNRMRTVLLSGVFLILLIVNIGTTVWAFKVVPYSRIWNSQLEKTIIEIDEKQGNIQSCPPAANGICNIEVSQRSQIISFLKTNNLNMFNVSFQNRYGPFPFISGLAGKVSVKTWGPRGALTEDGLIPNSQGEGIMGFWVVLSRRTGLSNITARFGKQQVKLVDNGDGVLTGAVQIKPLCVDPTPILSLVDDEIDKELEVGKFDCTSYQQKFPNE
jgi:hypothetical protein